MSGINFGAVKNTLSQWAINTLGNDAGVFWEPWPGTKMPKPSVGLNITGPRQVGFGDGFDGDNLGGQRQCTISVHSYTDNPNQFDQDGNTIPGVVGAGAIELANRLHTSLNDPTVVDFLFQGGIGIGQVMDVTDVSANLDTKIEDHKVFDFYIFLASNVTIDAGQISTVQLENYIPEV